MVDKKATNGSNLRMKDMLTPVSISGQFDHILKPKKDFKLDKKNRYYDLVNSTINGIEAISNDGSTVMYEGGGRSKNQRAGEKVKEIFTNEPMAASHIKKVGDDMQKHGSKEKTGFMEKEAEFVEKLREIQNQHQDCCVVLLKIGLFVYGIQFVYGMFCMIYFGCGVGDCQNGLICYLHYIKIVQSLVLMSSYNTNIKEKQPNHPIGTINTFLVICLYYGSLYRFMDELVETPQMIHFCALYPGLDLILIFISFCMIKRVKGESSKLKNNTRFKEYQQEAEIALADILYLPLEFESDDGEEEF